MRKALHTLWRALTAPLRLIAWPFRAVREFLNYEPEETSTADVFSRAFEEPAVLLEHLEALRRHLFRAVLVLAVIDRNILRLAVWEFVLSGETPVKVAINEAVELAKRFGSDSTPRFVNGVLGTLAAREPKSAPQTLPE